MGRIVTEGALLMERSAATMSVIGMPHFLSTLKKGESNDKEDVLHGQWTAGENGDLWIDNKKSSIGVGKIVSEILWWDLEEMWKRLIYKYKSEHDRLFAFNKFTNLLT